MTDDITMPITRELIFTNRRAYCITDTVNFMHDMRDRHDEEEFPPYVYDAIISTLEDQYYLVEVDQDEFIPDPLTGVLTLLDLWLLRWGVQDRTMAYFNGDDATIDTFDVTLSDDTFEEAITAEEEDEMLVGAHILLDMETIDDDMRDILGDDEEMSSYSV